MSTDFQKSLLHLRPLLGVLIHDLLNQLGSVSINLQVLETSDDVLPTDILRTTRRCIQTNQDSIQLLQIFTRWIEILTPNGSNVTVDSNEISKSSGPTSNELRTLATDLVQTHITLHSRSNDEVTLQRLPRVGLLALSSEEGLFDESRETLPLILLKQLSTDLELHVQNEGRELLITSPILFDFEH